MRQIVFIFVIAFLILSEGNMIAQISQEDQAAINRIEKYLSQSESNGLSGAVLIAKDGRILLNNGYGLADQEANLQNSPTTVFDIGSLTKQFTATAILKLEQLNKLKTTDSISKFFKDLPVDKKDITIHQLLIHSAGITRVIGKNDFDPIPTDEYFEELFATKLLHQPGSKYRYSNAGYSILSRIIELVSGQSYEAFLKEHLFIPAGMLHTGYLLVDWSNCEMAKGYNYNVLNIGTMVERYQKADAVSWVILGNGGINSTQEDMFKWYLALKNNKVLSIAQTEKLFTPYILEYEGETSYYAYGFVIFDTPRNTKMIAHDGSNATFFYDFRWLPEEDVLILYATNSFTDEVGGMAWRVDKMFFDRSYIPKEVKISDVSTLLEYCESYNGKSKKLMVAIKQNFEDKLDSPNILNRLGGIYARNNQLKEALMMAKLNVELFPNDANIWDTLGGVNYNVGKYKKAIKAFEKGLSLNPDMPWSVEMIEKIKSEN